jgi:hypothetical protein
MCIGGYMHGKKEGRLALLVLGTLLLLELPEGRPRFLGAFNTGSVLDGSAFSASLLSAMFSLAWLFADLSSREGRPRFFAGFNTGIALEDSTSSASSLATAAISLT